jgi:hypothetical protein
MRGVVSLQVCRVGQNRPYTPYRHYCNFPANDFVHAPYLRIYLCIWLGPTLQICHVRLAHLSIAFYHLDPEGLRQVPLRFPHFPRSLASLCLTTLLPHLPRLPHLPPRSLASRHFCGVTFCRVARTHSRRGWDYTTPQVELSTWWLP